MVKINEIKETTAQLYHKDILIGNITSFLQLNDVRIQIKEEALTDYYITWKDDIIYIDKFGKLNEWPEGFFTELDTQLDKLI